MTICKKRIKKIISVFFLFSIGFIFMIKIFFYPFQKDPEDNYFVLIPNSSPDGKLDGNLLLGTFPDPDSLEVYEKNIYYYSTESMCIEQKQVEILRSKDCLKELFDQWRIHSNIPENIILGSSSVEFGYENIEEFENSTIQEFTSSYIIVMDISHTIYPFFESNELVLDSLIQTVKEAYSSEKIALTILIDGMVIYEIN